MTAHSGSTVYSFLPPAPTEIYTLSLHDALPILGADLEAGMVMTVEPGLYFHENDLTVPPELRGIGVRLEDDLLLTASGAEVLSEALPIDATGIENWTRSHASSA